MQSDFSPSFAFHSSRPRARLLTLNGWLVLALLVIVSGFILGSIV